MPFWLTEDWKSFITFMNTNSGAITLSGGAAVGMYHARNKYRARVADRHDYSNDILKALCSDPDSESAFIDECGPLDIPDRENHHHNEYVFDALAHDSLERNEVYELVRNPDSRLKQNVVIVGGPGHGPGMAAALLGGLSKDVDAFAGLPFKLHYTFKDFGGEPEQNRIGNDGELVTGRNWAIVSDNQTVLPETKTKDNLLASDYLLITRVPNVFHGVSAAGHSIVNIAGLHGTGTRGISLLLDNPALAKSFCHDAPRSFQIIYEVSNIDHENGSEALAIEKFTDFVEIHTDHLETAASVMMSRLKSQVPLLQLDTQ